MAISPYSTAAQQGESYGQLRFDTKEAESYLSGAEQSSYAAATRGLGLEPKRGKGGKIKHLKKTQAAHAQAADKIKRLRDVASARAFDQYTTALGDYSKPWKVQAGPQGLVSATDIRDTMESDSTRSFGSMDVLAGKKMRETLSSMTSGRANEILDPSLLGDPNKQKRNQSALSVYGSPRIRGGGFGFAAQQNQRRAFQLGTAKRKGSVIDPERAYTGMGGGFDWSGRPADFGHGF